MATITPASYKLCYSSNIQTLFELLRKAPDTHGAGHTDAINKTLTALGMTLKCWKTPTGFYNVLKYAKSPLVSLYSAQTVSQQLAQDAKTVADTDTSPHDPETIQGRGLFRSVVINDAGDIVSFSPPKTITFNGAEDTPVLDADEVRLSQFVVEEFVEGTMINLFYNPNITAGSGSEANAAAGWEVSTKGVVGGAIVVPGSNKRNQRPPPATDEYAATTTFRSIFLDACLKNGIDFNNLDTKYSYSLVLQHPENPLITHLKTPRVYLIAMYAIDNTTLTVTRCARSSIDWKSIGFKLPREYSVKKGSTFSDIRNQYANPAGLSPYRIMGCMMHSVIGGEGWSFKLRNPSYEVAKHTPCELGKRMMFEYCNLRHTRDIPAHLAAYPDDAVKFDEFKLQIHVYTKLLYSSYVECFISKKQPLIDYAVNLRTHMYRMHNEIYKARRTAAASAVGTSAGRGSGLKLQDAIQYVNVVMTPTDLFYAITYCDKSPQTQTPPPTTTATATATPTTPQYPNDKPKHNII
jgi:hypothetical protein